MPSFQGTYSRRPRPDAFEAKRYLGVQQEVSLDAERRHWVDADWNEFVLQTIRQIQRVVQRGFGDGSPDDGFKVVEAAVTINDFKLKGGVGGEGDIEAGGRMWVGGLPAVLDADAEYKGPSFAFIHAVSTSLTATVLQDTSGRWNPNELVGRSLVPKASVPGTSYAITGNTASTITVAGDMVAGGAVAGDRYFVALSTPAAGRTDTVYLDTYLDEIDAVEDPDLDHGLAFGAASGLRLGATRLKLVSRILVNEGGKGHFVPSVPAGKDATLFRTYLDSNGERHWIVPIASLARLAGNAAVTTAMITDLRNVNWGMSVVRAGLVGPDHTAISPLRRLDEVRTWITVGDGVATFGDYNGEKGLRDAVTAASAMPGSGVWIKRGTYTLTAAIAVTGSVHIRGETFAGLTVGVKVIKAAGLYAFNGTGNGWSLTDVHVDCGDDPVAGVRATQVATFERVRVDNIGSVGIELAAASGVRVRDCVLVSDQNAAGIEITASASADIHVEGCTFSLIGADLTDYGIIIKGGAFALGIVIRDCQFLAGRGGVYAQASSSTTMRIVGCRFGAALTDVGVRTDQGNQSPVIEGCHFETGIGLGDILMTSVAAGVTQSPRLLGNWFGFPDVANPWVDLRKVAAAVVSGNVFAGAKASVMLLVDTLGEASADPGSIVSDNTFDGGGLATVGVDVGSNHKGTIVSGNHIYNVSGAAVQIGSAGCVVAGNVVRACFGGILVTATGPGTVIRGNAVLSDAGTSLAVAAADCVVTENTVRDGAGKGIDVGGVGTTAHRCVVTGNSVRNCTGDGIVLEGNTAKDCVVMGNVVSESGSKAITTGNGTSSGTVLMGNRCLRKVVGGTKEIDVSTSDRSVLIGNVCYKADDTLGDIAMDATLLSTDNKVTIDGNLGLVAGTVPKALSALAFKVTKLAALDNLALSGDPWTAGVHWLLKNGLLSGVGGDLYCELSEDVLPDGAEIQSFKFWAKAVGNGTFQARLTVTTLADGTVSDLGLYDINVDPDVADGAFAEVVLGVPTVVNHVVKAYTLHVRILAGADAVPNKLYRASITYKLTR